MNGRALYVGSFVERHEREAEQARTRREELHMKQKYLNLYINNLDRTIDDEQLFEEFSKFGHITSAKVRID